MNHVDAVRIQVALTGAIPAVVAMWVVDRLDRKRPEPPSLRRLCALAGMLSVILPSTLGGVKQSMMHIKPANQLMKRTAPLL